MSAPRPIPAILQAAMESETEFGGRSGSWPEVATLWVVLFVAPPGQQFDGAVASPSEAETASAVCRQHPVAAAGQRLLVGDDPDPWRVRRVDRETPAPGRMTLRLDRLA